MHVDHDGVTIAYETSGADGDPLLLIQGLGQLISWPDDLRKALVDAGFHVAVLDNRDVGLSTHFPDAGTPSPFKLMTRPAAAAPYSLLDLAHDALAVMDALDWPTAHVLGFSQGGMIAQKVATIAPERVRTLTSISSTPSPRIGKPKLGTLLAVGKIAKRPVHNVEDYVRHMLDLQALVTTEQYPVDEPWLRDMAARSYQRCYDQPGVQRLSAAFQGSGDRRSELAAVTAPTLVVHGDADVITRPEGGLATATAIPGAELVTYPGMGQDLPRPLWPDIITRLGELAQRQRLER